MRNYAAGTVSEIVFEGHLGTDIHDVAAEMRRLSQLHNCTVKCLFNGAMVYAYPEYVDPIVTQYYAGSRK